MRRSLHIVHQDGSHQSTIGALQNLLKTFMSLAKSRFRLLGIQETIVLFASILIPLLYWGRCTLGYPICFNDADWADYRLHYVAINSYLNSSQWLPTYQQAFTWPHQSSLLYADAFPLLSLILWPVYQIVKFPVGLIFPALSILNSLLIACCSIVLSRKLRLSNIQLLSLSFFLLTSPISWNRLLAGHESLQLHSLVIVPLVFLIIANACLWQWTALLAVTSGINPYFLPFALCCFIIVMLKFRPSAHILHKLTSILGVCIICASVIVICGYIPGYAQNMSDVWGANILALLNPQDTSSIVDSIQISEPYETEGYSYLGIALILFTCITFVTTSPKKLSIKVPSMRYSSYLCMFFLILSWGLTWNISNQPIISPYHYVGLHKMFVSFYGIFRSAGRFTWPIYYLIIIWCISSLEPRFFRNILILGIVIQLTELVLPMMSRLNLTYDSRVTRGTNPSMSWISGNPRVESFINSSSYFISQPTLYNQHTDQMPPYTPQLINPVIKSNWGGVNLSRIPSASVTLENTLLNIPYGSKATLYLPNPSQKLLAILQNNFTKDSSHGNYLLVTRNRSTSR